MRSGTTRRGKCSSCTPMQAIACGSEPEHRDQRIEASHHNRLYKDLPCLFTPSQPILRDRLRERPGNTGHDRHQGPRRPLSEPLAMVATIGQMASAEYYLESQRSFRHPNEYYTAGEEPDGTWFNTKGLLGLEDGEKVDSGHFHRLYSGFAPDGSAQAGAAGRQPGPLPRRGHDLLGGQERVLALGHRRAGVAPENRGDGGLCRAGGGRGHGVPALQLHPCRQQWRHPSGRGGSDGRHLRPRHEPGERPAAPRALHDLQPRENQGRRQVAGASPVPGL